MKTLKIKRNISVRLLLTLVTLDHLQSLHMKREAGTNVFTQFSNEYTFEKNKVVVLQFVCKSAQCASFCQWVLFWGVSSAWSLVVSWRKKLLNKMT